MATYSVTLPITGIVCIEVEANSEAEAIELASDNVTDDHIEQWETHKKIVQGNVFYGVQNKVEIELIED